MANNIVLKRSSVADRVPSTSDLEYGELAINYTDEKLYFKNASNTIKSFTVGGFDPSAVDQSIVPDTDEAYDLGSSSLKWRDLYLSGNTIQLGGATISADANKVVLPDVSEISRGGGVVEQIATVSKSTSRSSISVPLYTKSSGLSTVARYERFSTAPTGYTNTSFTFSDGSTPNFVGTTIFHF